MSGSRPPGVTLSNWDLGGEPSAWAYLHAGELFPSVEIPTGGPSAELASAEAAEIGLFPVQPGVTLDQYVATGPVSGIVVVWRGRIAFERYPRMRPSDRHLLMSVTKAFTAAVAGILELTGILDLRQPVDRLIGELAGSGWAGVRGTDVLGMTSGIDCLEIDVPGAYNDPGHSFYRFEASLGWRPAGREPVPSPYEFVAALPSYRPPGQVYEYTSVNTFVVSWLVERAAGMPFADVLAREIWLRTGFEAPAALCCSSAGAPASHGGLSTTLRDLARFGMLFTPSARLVSELPVISPEHLRRIQTGGRPELHSDSDEPLAAEMSEAYGPNLPPASRQWDFAIADGDLFKGGFGGQGLYVSPARDLVIAFAGIPDQDGSVNALRWISRRLAVTIG